jgi:hypothetical protein
MLSSLLTPSNPAEAACLARPLQTKKKYLIMRAENSNIQKKYMTEYTVKRPDKLNTIISNITATILDIVLSFI